MKKFDGVMLILIFYVGWFVSVFLASTPYSVVSLVLPAILLVFMLKRGLLNQKSFSLAIAISILGLLFDWAMLMLGFISTVGATFLMIPIWLLSIWLLFSFSIVRLGASLHPPLWLASILGFVMGPLSYKSGEFFNVLSFTAPLTFLFYAVFWAMMFPIIVIFSKRLA